MAARGEAALVAGDDPDPAVAAAAAALRAEQEEIWIGGNPNHLVKAEALAPLEADLILREVLRKCQRISKDELTTYHILPGHFNMYGEAVRELIFELYEALENSSRARRRLLKLMLDGQEEIEAANVLRALLKEDDHVLRANPDEIYRIKGRYIVKVPAYMLLDPALLPKPMKMKKARRSRK